MLLHLLLASSSIDPRKDHVLIIGGLENLLRIANINDTDNLLRRFAINQDISHLRKPEANTTGSLGLETIDLTVYPPKLHSQPLRYVLHYVPCSITLDVPFTALSSYSSTSSNQTPSTRHSPHD
ncbi:hypothetical protein M422DRAFT_267725 [Sphaerobolus stellatus SS14]|uniref:Uncharacterized protein n=1 Tax=Sphaerobolus stellatus (strain SS14) TaxID=990650 RepID=A0A0C9U8B9_SPHS4|nr:hypothetical protein M422DRAFT_267725 [Sphaerobolus stellatus SS14]